MQKENGLSDTTDPALYQALADIGCKLCEEQLGCCLGGPPDGLPVLADMILEAVRNAGYRIVRDQTA